MKLMLTILSCWLVVDATNEGLSLIDERKPGGRFNGDFSEPVVIGPKVAKQFVTNHHRSPSTYNPCDHKECSTGYSCMAISNQYLLQVSVAVCVPDSIVEIADNPPCITIVLGGGQMGCKTQEEWEKIGSIHCGIRVTSNAAYNHTTKVNHHCIRGRNKSEHTFMQAEINCCPTEPIIIDYVTPQDESDNHSADVDDPSEETSLQKRNTKAVLITVTSISFITGFVLLMVVGCLAYRKHQYTKQPHPVDGGMSFINHNCDAYEEANFDPKKPLVMYPPKDNSSEDHFVQNPLVSSK